MYEHESHFNATTVAPAAGPASIWSSESAADLQPFYWDCIKKARPELCFYGRGFPRSHWPDGYYEDKSNFHANTLIHSREWSMTARWRIAWLGVKERVWAAKCVFKCAFYGFLLLNYVKELNVYACVFVGVNQTHEQ